MAKIIDIGALRDDALKEERRRLSRMFVWAQNEQRRLGCVADSLRLTFETDWIPEGETDKGSIFSVFVDSDTGKTLLRLDWLADMVVRYYLIANFEEVKQIAPNSARNMLKNAEHIYRTFEGDHCGTYHYVDGLKNTL